MLGDETASVKLTPFPAALAARDNLACMNAYRWYAWHYRTHHKTG